MNSLRLAVTLFILATASANASIIERTYYLPTALGGPNSGWSWALEHYPIEPFAPSRGDTLILHLQFDHRLLVQDIGPKTDDEMIMITLDSGATTEGGVDALSFGTFAFPDATGALLTPTVGWGTDSGGFGIGAQRFTNLTDGAFSFSRLDVTWDLVDFYFTPPMSDLRYIWTTFNADVVRVLPVPEPSSLALVGAALFGVAATRRRRLNA